MAFTRDDLKRMYLRVFEDDLITLRDFCSRDAKMDLVRAFGQEDIRTDFGDYYLGIMNVDNVRAFGRTLFVE